MDQCPQGHLWWWQQKFLDDHKGLSVLVERSGYFQPWFGFNKEGSIPLSFFIPSPPPDLLSGVLLGFGCPAFKLPFSLGGSPYRVNFDEHHGPTASH